MFYLKNKFLYFFQLLVISFNYLFNKTFNEKELLKKYLRRNSIVFDVGSNLGSYIKFVNGFSKKNSIEFHSFEPNKSLVQLQKKMNLKNKLIVNNNVVLDTHNIDVEFYERSISSHSSIIPSPQMSAISKHINQYEVKTLRIDEYCRDNNIKYIDLLKIDAEGVDFEVLVSCENMLIKNCIKMIKIEIWINEENPSKIFNYLSNFGFVLIGITNLSYLNNKLKFYDAYFLNSH